MAGKFDQSRSNEATSLGSDAAKHTPADTDLPINIKAVVCSADGTIDFKNAAGTARAGYPVKGGVPLAFVPARITAVSTGDVWLIS
jgi:hypothetical protein